MDANGNYAAGETRLRTFSDAVPGFLSGVGSPREYLEQCLSTIEAREPVVQAWVTLNVEAARESADASARRYKQGKPLSSIDGMPIGIKDLFQTRDMPTEQGSPIYKGARSGNDSALVRALRDAGAIVLGKTVTTEFGMSHPGPTTNPFDPRRTPGGSSSGSAAAVGAGMVPVCIGSQLLGSVIRPAGYCANVAIKPTLGAIHRGERMGNSQSHVGVHAGSVVDMWNTTYEVAARAGGDPGYPGLYGAAATPQALKPRRLIVMETEAWRQVEAPTAEAFDRVLHSLRKQGVEVLRRSDHELVEDFEQAIADNMAMCRDLIGFEGRWNYENLFDRDPELLSESLHQRLARWRTVTREQYRAILLRRQEARNRHAALAHVGDALIALSSNGPAAFFGDQTGSGQGIVHTTGTPAMAAPSSMLGAPSVVVPLLSVHRMPLGVQVVGQPHDDERTVGIARWMLENLPVASVA
jgi:Asp-tRNA(Asn)/Glu-tRNA(Gln) amidotransferase A subunit family amidase